MATAASARPTPASRRSPASAPGAAATTSITKGATARSAVSPRVAASLSNGPSRRASVKSPPPAASAPAVNGETRETLSASLKEETEKKEQLLVQVQDKDASIATLNTENDNLRSSLNAANVRLAELYADQSRMEEEMSSRMEVMEKLRAQVRELEKEKRDVQRRYNEQTATFDAERQAFYDNEQHLKSRIQSLTQARKQPPPILTSPSTVSIAETAVDEEETPETPVEATKQDVNDPEQEPAEMTALRLELSTLSVSYNSLHSTLVLLQSQLNDVKRVNHELQEENESYNILLREKTLSGQFDVLRMGGASSVASESEAGDDDDRDAESLRSRATSRSALDPVDEVAEEHEHHEVGLDPQFGKEQPEAEPQEDEDAKISRRGPRRRTTSRASPPPPRGESLANLPITGPGLDLAAELGRAENKDILDGHTLENDKSVLNAKGRKGRKSTDAGRKMSSASDTTGMEPSRSATDLDALRSEVKSLKDANKALSLYASKIIDRIIMQEGFEHVLAVDYDKHPTSPTPQTATFTTFSNLPKSNQTHKKRPQSVFSFSSLTSPATSSVPFSPQPERLTTFDDIRAASASNSPNLSGPPAPAPSTRASRRSLSFDWKGFSMFGGDKKPDAHLRPLTLKAGQSSVTGARKLETHEDEEDRRERERLAATMRLMGIEKPLAPTMPAMGQSLSSPAEPPRTPGTATPAAASRFPFFRRANSDTSSVHSSQHGAGLTTEALAEAEAENALAALDAQERQLSAEIAKGSPGGFTEITRRSGDKRSSRRSGSGSTVWSAGMKGEDD